MRTKTISSNDFLKGYVGEPEFEQGDIVYYVDPVKLSISKLKVAGIIIEWYEITGYRLWEKTKDKKYKYIQAKKENVFRTEEEAIERLSEIIEREISHLKAIKRSLRHERRS